MNEDDLIAQNAVLIAENARLKKKVQELEHLRLLNQTEIIGLRRQIEWWEVEHNIDCKN